MNLFLKNSQSTKHSTLKFWDVHSSAFIEKGQTNGVCIITLHLPI